MSAIHYMQRCLELAKLGAGSVAPNPMVGAVLVYNNKVIGEGWHKQYGEAHAEVNCINSVREDDKQFISQSTLYVSLEPCAHYGKTPPCVDLIIKYKIPYVFIGCRDPFKEVDGKGIEKLNVAGVKVELADRLLSYECQQINKRFFTFHTAQRPYIILKWAQTADEKISSGNGERLLISNEYTNRLVHRWRSEEAAILVGTNTALLDDPELTTRLWPGKSPVRLVVDMDLKLPSSAKIFNKEAPTVIFNSVKQEEEENILYYRIPKGSSLIHQLLNALYKLKIQSVLVEGGAKLLQSFIDDGLWDEARIINNEQLIINNGLDAPILKNAEKISGQKLLSDKVAIYKLKHS